MSSSHSLVRQPLVLPAQLQAQPLSRAQLDPMAAARLAAPGIEQMARIYLDDIVLPNDLVVECPGGPPPMFDDPPLRASDVLVVIGVHVDGPTSRSLVARRIDDTFIVVACDSMPGGDLIVCATPSGVLPEE
jgi:hypothetical protein